MTATICKDTIPLWLLSLKAGDYTIKQVQKITGQKSYDNVYQRFTALGLSYKMSKTLAKNGRPVRIYSWPGAEEQSIIIVKRRVKESRGVK